MRRLPKIFISLLLFLFLLTCFYLFRFKTLISFLPYLLGKNAPTTYTILLQNDTEIRANGGFAGSFAKVSISSSNFKIPKIDLSFQDIYVPNGQLNGYVKPPEPIQTAFQHGTWELANADWDPDFPSSAKDIRWFLEKGKENNPDILATLNLSTIKKILHIIGEFRVPELDVALTPDNFYLFLQSKVETDFFPGSTKKKDTLTSVGAALKHKFFSLNPLQYLKIAFVIKEDLDHSNLLLHSLNPQFQDFLLHQGWAGSISPKSLDHYLLVETNLGANKANCCITRLTEHTIFPENNTYRHRVHLSLSNSSTGRSPHPPFDFSGHYVSYLRFYIPSDSWNIEVSPNQSTPSASPFIPTQNISISQNFGFTEIGFFHTTSAGTTSTIDLSYFLATGSASQPYQLSILKQNGLASSPQAIIYQGKSKNFPLTTPVTITY